MFRQLVPRQGDDGRESLIRVPAMPLRLPSLPGEAPHLRLDFGNEVRQTLKVSRGLLETPLRALFPVAVPADSRGFLEERAPLLGAVGKEPFDHLRFDHDAGVAAEPGSPKRVEHVAQAHRCLIQEVVALSAS